VIIDPWNEKAQPPLSLPKRNITAAHKAKKRLFWHKRKALANTGSSEQSLHRSARSVFLEVVHN